MIETRVNDATEYQGRLCLIEQVPVRVCQDTGEEYFSPKTVEHIQALIKSGRPPARAGRGARTHDEIAEDRPMTGIRVLAASAEVRGAPTH